MGACQVELIVFKRTCSNAPAFPFAATCACGHEITGRACRLCRHAKLPGCLTCWRTDGHRCPVEFGAPLQAASTGGA